MLPAPRLGASRAARRRTLSPARRLLAGAAAMAALGAGCLAGSLAVAGPVDEAAAAPVSIADLAEAGAQEYGTTLVSGQAADRGGDLGVTSVNPRDKNALKAIAAEMIGAYGWGAAEMQCLDLLWEKESNWNPFAENAESGAYGIPQSWPAEKLATAGADWRTNPVTQMRWGMDYIKAVYGSPCTAWNQHAGSY